MEASSRKWLAGGSSGGSTSSSTAAASVAGGIQGSSSRGTSSAAVHMLPMPRAVSKLVAANLIALNHTE